MKKADPNSRSLPCVFCEKDCMLNEGMGKSNQDIEKQGYNKSVVIHTQGNYGSQIIDLGGILSFIICDECIIKHSPKMLYRETIRQENASEYFLNWFNSLTNDTTLSSNSCGWPWSYIKDVAPYFLENEELELNLEKYLTAANKFVRDFIKKKLQQKDNTLNE